MSDLGVSDLVWALHHVLERFELDSISASRLLPDGHTLTLRLLSGDLMEIERDDGEVVTVPLAEVSTE